MQAVQSCAEVSLGHSVHTQIWELHLIDWDRLVLGMPGSDGQGSRWTGRRAVTEEEVCQEVYLKAAQSMAIPP